MLSLTALVQLVLYSQEKVWSCGNFFRRKSKNYPSSHHNRHHWIRHCLGFRRLPFHCWHWRFVCHDRKVHVIFIWAFSNTDVVKISTLQKACVIFFGWSQYFSIVLFNFIFLLHFPDEIPQLNGVHNLVRHLNVVHKYYMRVYFLLLRNMSEEFRATKQNSVATWMTLLTTSASYIVTY